MNTSSGVVVKLSCEVTSLCKKGRLAYVNGVSEERNSFQAWIRKFNNINRSLSLSLYLSLYLCLSLPLSLSPIFPLSPSSSSLTSGVGLVINLAFCT